MLVLSRKKEESVVIGNDITVTILEVRGDKVRLGIEAPKDVPVHRQEVWANIQEENASAPAVPGRVASMIGNAPLAAKVGRRA